MTPIDNVLGALEGRIFRKGTDRWMAICPAHDDRSPSLSVREASDGRVLLHCFAGCHAIDVVEAMGFTLAEMFPYDRNFTKAKNAIAEEIKRDQESEDAVFVKIIKADIAAGRPVSERDKQRYRKIVRRLRAA